METILWSIAVSLSWLGGMFFWHTTGGCRNTKAGTPSASHNSDLMQLLCDIKERVDVEGRFDNNDTSTYEKLAAVVAQQQ